MSNTIIILENGAPVVLQLGEQGPPGAPQPPVVNFTGTALTAAPAGNGKYTRFTNAAAKTYTFDAAQGYATATEYHGRNVGAGILTLEAVGGFTLNPPTGGTLIVPPGGTFTVKIVGADEADVFGAVVSL